MAYIRRQQQGVSRPSSTFEGFVDEGIRNPPPLPASPSSSFGASPNDLDSSFPSSPTSLPAKAPRPVGTRLSPLCTATPTSPMLLQILCSPELLPLPRIQEPMNTSIKGLNESKHGFWDVLARKAKSILMMMMMMMMM